MRSSLLGSLCGAGLAAALLAGCSDDQSEVEELCRDAEAWPAEWGAFEDEVLTLVNARRSEGATCGNEARPPVAAIAMDADLREAARCHSLDMAKNDYFSHDSQDGRSAWDRMGEAGYTGSPSAENIAAGSSTPADAVATWMDSPEHCGNIMGDHNEIGVGYALQEGSGLGHYWTQTFGRR